MRATEQPSLSSSSGGGPRRPRRRPGILLFAVAVACGLLGCARPRDIWQPLEGAIERTVADSARFVFDAAARAITDEGMSIGRHDEERGVVESTYQDIVQLKGFQHLDQYPAQDRVIKLRFWTRSTFGGTRLYAEAVYQPSGATARFSERMVPADHPARELLTRVLGRLDEHLRERRQRDDRRGG